MRHTERMTVTLTVPRKKPVTFFLPIAARKTVEEFFTNSFEEDDDILIAAEVVLPDLADPVLRPAAILRGSRAKEKMTQKELAKKLGVLQHHLSEMEHGKRPIGKQMAKKMAAVFNTDYRLFV